MITDYTITDYHAKLFAHELSQRHPLDSVERFTATLMDSEVDLNPHQIDAALFAFRSPFSKGAILADEVGLGKTIEAGIVLSQKWAERKRKILIILPSSLRKQWHQELQDKFYLPSEILESRSFSKALKEGHTNPFALDTVAICSYPFARNKADYLRRINWDLVVIDEAHRLRNVYKSGNKIARDIKTALEHAPKLLLTATPLQNSLLELYGLVSFIDEHAFGDIKSFKAQFARLQDDSFADLKERLKPICKRTLRRQVLEYISYTKRQAYTQEFVPTEDEEVLYEMVSDYLRRPDLQALPASQRSLMTLVMRKLLASSTFAIAGAMESLKSKLEQRLKEADTDPAPKKNEPHRSELDRGEPGKHELAEDFEIYDELAEEYDDEVEALSPAERAALAREIAELSAFADLATSITQNAKGEALIGALRRGFDMTHELGGAQKAIIFTESRRTQDYLVNLLSQNGYADQIVLFNGSNASPKAREIYADWKEAHQNTDRATGSRSADTRAALVDYFKDSAKIMIATEAAAEGINLQFCSLVVNYDLPWNPQRIEQRIGRCHRYGQKHDVVVVNFLNKSNAADQRVYELLSEKFSLFNGVFGASDEVLGSIESGVDFEKRIVNIYQNCRTSEEIQASFDALQSELSQEIDENMFATRQKLLENFDSEVAEKLNIYSQAANASLNRYETLLWTLSQHELGTRATFDEKASSFTLSAPPTPDTSRGRYSLQRHPDAHHYRLHHPLAAWVLAQAAQRTLDAAHLTFNYTHTPHKISILEPFVGQSGALSATKLTVSAAQSEDHLVLCAVTCEGAALSQEVARRLFNLPATLSASQPGAPQPNALQTNTPHIFQALQSAYTRQKNLILEGISERGASYFDEEMDKLDRWADDKRQTLKSVLKDHDDAIKDLKKQERTAPNLPEKLALRKKLRTVEKKRDDAWRDYDEAAKTVERQKDALIDKVEAQLQQTLSEEPLFTLHWSLI